MLAYFICLFSALIKDNLLHASLCFRVFVYLVNYIQDKFILFSLLNILNANLTIIKDKTENLVT